MDVPSEQRRRLSLTVAGLAIDSAPWKTLDAAPARF